MVRSGELPLSLDLAQRAAEGLGGLSSCPQDPHSPLRLSASRMLERHMGNVPGG